MSLPGLTLLDALLLAITLATGWLLLHPKLLNNHFWRATVTPLASIIGSGFLIVAPLLGEVAGRHAVLAMLGIVLFAWFIGTIIRFNIAHAEPLEHGGHDAALHALGRIASLALSVAYVISVAFYIRLLAAFALSMTPWHAASNADLLATVILAGIGILGLLHGFRGLEWTETIAVSVKLSIIAALLLGLLWHDVANASWTNTAAYPTLPLAERLRMLAGMLLIAQGFETSRYLGGAYPAKVRIRSMRIAQVLSGLIYVGFVLLVQPLLQFLPAGKPDETAIITLTRHVALVLPWLLVIAALMSQLSAAIADTAGAGGLIAEETHRLLRERYAYPLLIAAAILLIWTFDIFQVVAIASRAFAFYYMMEALIAFRAAQLLPAGQRRAWHSPAFLLMALLLALVVVFARAAGG